MNGDFYAVLPQKLEFSFCPASEMPAVFTSVGWKVGKEGLVGVGVTDGPMQMHGFLGVPERPSWDGGGSRRSR